MGLPKLFEIQRLLSTYLMLSLHILYFKYLTTLQSSSSFNCLQLKAISKYLSTNFMLLKGRNDHSAEVELWTLCQALSFALFLGHAVVHGDLGEETGQDWDSEQQLLINHKLFSIFGPLLHLLWSTQVKSQLGLQLHCLCSHNQSMSSTASENYL